MRICNPIVLQTLTHVLCHILAVDFTNERIHRIDTSANTARGDDVAVFYPASCWHPGDVRSGRGSPSPAAFVCCGFAAVKDTGARQDCSACADGDDVFQLGALVNIV